MPKILLASVIGLVAYLALTVSSVSAQTTARFYDWSSTVDTRDSKVLGITVFAQEASGSANVETTVDSFKQYNRYLLGANLTPGSFFYFIKPFQENLVLTFTTDPKQKESLRLEIAGERLEEMQKLVSSANAGAINNAVNNYKSSMESATSGLNQLQQQNTSGLDVLIKEVEQETAKHNIVLEEAAVKAPEGAKDEMQGAIEAAWKSTDLAADLSGRVAVPPDVVDRLKALQSQGLLSDEEVTKIVSVKTRTEAREELKKFVKEGVVSGADFSRMNENVKAFFPDEFYKIHETKRFLEMQKLEQQKPDDSTLAKIQDFAKTYKQGDSVPSPLRRYWVSVVRLEELQNTLRPDLIDATLFRNDSSEAKKFTEVVERFKPRPEDIAYVSDFIQKNNADVSSLPPEYQRMYNLAKQYGAQCGAGQHWQSEGQGGGFCLPDGSNIDTSSFRNLPAGKSCNGLAISAKGPTGACGSYTSDCVPPGWSIVSSCVQTPTSTAEGSTGSGKIITCPSNAHFVSVPYDPNGGYCIPNYTRVGNDSTTGLTDSACPAGYHRSYSGGPCIPDYNSSSGNSGSFNSALSPITSTPGGAYYTGSGQCGQGANWVPEPINPRGGYCAPSSYQGNDSGSNNNANSGPSRESQEAACRAGGGICRSWVNGACGCERPNSGTTNTYPNPNTNTNTNPTPVSGSSGVSPSRESQEAACRAGGGICRSWVNGACGCERPNSGTTGGNTPPSGYGSCGAGLYWNGSGCTSSTSNQTSGSGGTNDSPEAACGRAAGCSWNGSSCNCSSGGGSTSPSPENTTQQPPTTTSSPSEPAPVQETQQTQQAPPPAEAAPAPSP